LNEARFSHEKRAFALDHHSHKMATSLRSDFMNVSIAEAKDRLPQLIRAVERGEHVTITRHGKPVLE
jgi:hypothetical protein